MRNQLIPFFILMGSISMTQPAAIAATKITLQSTAFKEGQEIPKEYTGEGRDISPPLLWQGAPKETREFAIICDDPDAPSGEPWVHWVAYHIPGPTTHLPENIPAQQKLDVPIRIEQGVNSFDTFGYRGPMPPPGDGRHRYFFKLYALDSSLVLSGDVNKEKLLKAMKGHILTETQLMGQFQRKIE